MRGIYAQLSLFVSVSMRVYASGVSTLACIYENLCACVCKHYAKHILSTFEHTCMCVRGCACKADDVVVHVSVSAQVNVRACVAMVYACVAPPSHTHSHRYTDTANGCISNNQHTDTRTSKEKRKNRQNPTMDTHGR